MKVRSVQSRSCADRCYAQLGRLLTEINSRVGKYEVDLSGTPGLLDRHGRYANAGRQSL
jgi:hypothetical protein